MVRVRWSAKSRALRAGSDVRRLAADAVARSAIEAMARARLNAPRRTGNLANSIFAEPETELRWAVGTPVYYAPFVELGTRRMAPRPYLMPAMEEAHRMLVEILKRIEAVLR